jgi:hypothetical protein
MISCCPPHVLVRPIRWQYASNVSFSSERKSRKCSLFCRFRASHFFSTTNLMRGRPCTHQRSHAHTNARMHARTCGGKQAEKGCSRHVDKQTCSCISSGNALAEKARQHSILLLLTFEGAQRAHFAPRAYTWQHSDEDSCRCAGVQRCCCSS